MKQAYMWVSALNDFAIHFQNQPQDTVRCWMLWPKI
jgi:hypothetical protein